MFIDKLKRDYLVYLAAAFVARLPRIFEILQGPEQGPDIALKLVVSVFTILVFAFLLYCIGFCIGRLVDQGRTYFSKNLKEGER